MARKNKADTAETVTTRIYENWFTVDFIRDPEKAAETWSTDKTKEGFQKVLSSRWRNLAEQVAEETNSSVDQVIDPTKRTKEQEEASRRVFVEDIKSRLNTLMLSRYAEAWRALDGDNLEEKEANLAKMAIIYFFGTLPKDEPGILDIQVLSKEDKQEIKAIFENILAFEKENPLQDFSGEEITRLMLAFIEADTSTEGQEQGNIIIKSIVPAHLLMVNNALENDLHGIQGRKPINAGGYDMPVIRETRKRKGVSAYVIITDETNKGISSLTENERNISTALYSIWAEAEKTGRPAAFDLESLYKSMPGGGEKITAKQKEEALRAIDSFPKKEIFVDATDEMRRRKKIGENEEYQIKGPYFPAFEEHIYTTTRGKGAKEKAKDREKSIKKSVWIIPSKPINLKYAEMTGQIVTIPADLMKIESIGKNGKPSGNLIKMNQARQAMASCIMRRVAVIVNDYKTARDAYRKHLAKRKKDQSLEEKTLADFRHQSDTVLFDYVFRTAGIEGGSPIQEKRDRDFCFDVLDFWQAKNFINGYTVKKDGKAIKGFIIQHMEPIEKIAND